MSGVPTRSRGGLDKCLALRESEIPAPVGV